MVHVFSLRTVVMGNYCRSVRHNILHSALAMQRGTLLVHLLHGKPCKYKYWQCVIGAVENLAGFYAKGQVLQDYIKVMVTITGD